MIKTFMDLVNFIRKEVLEKEYNDLVVAIYDRFLEFRLYDDESVSIVYTPYEYDFRNNDYKIAIKGLPDDLDDITELTEIYKITKLIEKYRYLIDFEVFDIVDEDEEDDAE